MENLKKIVYDDNETAFRFETDKYNCDRIRTKLILDDYDWMNYRLEAWFPTIEQGILYVTFEFSGLVDSKMKVRQTLDSGENIYHTYAFSTNIFQENILKFMEKHMKSWDDNEYGFYGGEEAVAFYNTVLDKANGCVSEREQKS